MHEYSVVSALLDQCETIVQEHKATSVISLDVKIGILSGVEISQLKIAFDTFKQGSVCQDAKLNIELQPLLLQCDDCQKISEQSSYDTRCPACNSTKTQIIDGEDMYLMRLDLDSLI